MLPKTPQDVLLSFQVSEAPQLIDLKKPKCYNNNNIIDKIQCAINIKHKFKQTNFKINQM
jgi:hypothetical protein